MCRLLGAVSARPASLAETLDADLHAFAELSALHCDGWGHAYLHGRDLTVVKAPEAALDSEQFWRSVGRASTDAALLHLRMASPGLAVDGLSTHPFERDGVAFAHNGFAGTPAVLDHLVREYDAPRARGTTDSERYFSLVLAGMRDRSPAEALWWAAERISERADDVTALNALLLTDQALYAFECWSPDAPPRPEAGEASYQLFARVTPELVTVASDGWEATSGWEPVGNGNVLEIRRGDLATTVHEARASLLA